MAKLTALLLAASITAANAHPSLVGHDHPHVISTLAGLDTLMLAALVVAVALVAWKRVRS